MTRTIKPAPFFLFALVLLTYSSLSNAQTVVGNLATEFSVSQGVATYSVPIEVAPGRAGMQPELALTYNSGGGNGALGVGWSLSGMSAIHRCPKTLDQDGEAGGIQFDEEDRYCLDGQRLLPIAGINGEVNGEYRTEIDSYAHITAHGGSAHHPDYWVVKTKAGHIMTYGGGLANQALAQGTVAWSLRMIHDTTVYARSPNPSDAIVYRYQWDANTQYLQEIRYPGGRVEFTYDKNNRHDNNVRYAFGHASQMHWRLARINTFGGRHLDPLSPLSEYRIDYHDDDRQAVSQLTRITRCATGGACLKPLELAWVNGAGQDGNEPEPTPPELFHTGTSSTGSSATTSQFYFYDVNGDSRTDYIRHNRYEHNGRFFVHLAQADGRYGDAVWSGGGADGRHTQFYFHDVNNDNFVDYILHDYGWYGGQFRVHLGRGDGSFGGAVWQGGGSSGTNTEFYFHDFNNDSIIDYALHDHGWHNGQFQVHLGRGDGSFSDVVWQGGGSTGSNTVFYFHDFNNDSIMDYALHDYGWHNGQFQVHLGRGDGSFGGVAWQGGGSTGTNTRFYFADYNGDNIVDYLLHDHGWHHGQFQVHLGQGDGRFTGVVWQGGGSPSSQTDFTIADLNHDGISDVIHHNFKYNGSNLLVQFGDGQGGFGPTQWAGAAADRDNLNLYLIDSNGDGALDIARQHSSIDDGRVHVFLNNTQPQAFKLRRITEPNGSSTEISYQALSDPELYTPSTGSRYPYQDVLIPQYVVSRVESSTGSGGSTRVNYQYAGLKAHLRGRGILGFAAITEHYPDTHKTTLTEFDHNGFPLSGRVSAVTEQYRGATINRIVNTYGVVSTDKSTFEYALPCVPPPGGACRPALNTLAIPSVHLLESVQTSYELGDDHNPEPKPITTVTTRHEDIRDYGNIGRIVVSTEGINPLTGLSETFTQTTTSTFRDDDQHWLLGRLHTSVVSHEGPNGEPLSRRSEFHYDPITGLLVSEAITNADNTRTLSTTTYTYDAYGQKTAVTVSAAGEPARRSRTTYNDSGKVTQRCNALNHCETYTYTEQGWRTSHTGPNGLTTTWTHDDFGRHIREDRADGTWTTTARHFASHYDCGDPAEQAYSCVISQQAGAEPRVVQRDPLGRTVRTITTGFDKRLIYSDTEYNAQAQVAQVSRPYYHGNQRYWATSEYDALGRVVRISEPDPHGGRNEMLTDYRGLVTTVRSGPELRAKTTTTNALGQTIRIAEETGTYTDYRYGNDGKLLTTQVAGDHHTLIQLTYDEFGRKIHMNDPDMGEWHYGYNGFGELIQQSTPNEHTVTITYDPLGRMLSRMDAEGTSTWEYYDHNAPAGSRGKLYREHGPGIQRSFLYDHLGRPQATTTQIGQERFTSALSYDELGRIKRTRYPGSQGFWTENRYNDQGLLHAVVGSRAQAEAHDTEQVRGLIELGMTLAQDYLDQALALQHLADYYQALSGDYSRLLGDPTLAKQHSNFSQQLAWLQTLQQDLSHQITQDHATAEQLIVLSEQSLAAVDHSYQLAHTAEHAADIYQDLLNEQDSELITYWRVADVDASGRISAEVYGNGIVNDYAYNQATGQLLSAHASLLSIEPLRHVEYQYDAYQNLTQRHDLVNDIHERYRYDRLDRLSSNTVQSTLYPVPAFNNTQNQTYDGLGNITYKSDVGHYRYGEHGAGPHAVSSAGDKQYRYDPNGNMLSGDGRTITWSSFNKPTRITRGDAWSHFQYDMNRARYQKTNHHGDTTLYIGKLYERLTTGDQQTEQKHYIYAGGQLIAEHIVSSTHGTQTRYLHQDALGSIDLVTDAFAKVVDRRSFDAWGTLRPLPWHDQARLEDPLYLTQLPFTNKGYTGHEQIQEVGLIHMGGRVYDPVLARFISADPHIQAGSLSQSYNRYSYVINNPLKYNDPSGYFFKKLFRGIKKAFNNLAKNPVVRTVAGIAAAYFVGAWAYAKGFSAGFSSTWSLASAQVSGAVAAGAAGGFAGSLVATGGDFKSAVIGGLTGAAAGFIGASSAFGQVGSTTPGRVVAHGVTGGTASVLQGGKFGHGFVSSAFTKMVSKPIQGLAENAGAIKEIAGATAAALVGGTASQLGGGKFSNGAQTAAIQYLFNQAASSAKKLSHKYEYETEICSRSGSECTAANVWGAVKDNSVPFQDGTLTDGTVSNIPGIGTVVTRVDDSIYTLVNETQEDHLFKHGSVTRSLVITEDAISVRTVGVGTNTNYGTWGANYAASPYFKGLDYNIKATIGYRQFKSNVRSFFD